jgi:CIC family chloride channel protein
MRWRATALSPEQLEYLNLILLAAAVGTLGALGNLCFRGLIELFSWVFRGLEWRALGIGHGGWHLALLPIVLLSGGVLIIGLDYLFPGDVLGYGFPNFLEMVNLGGARIKRRWIFLKAAGAALSLGAGASVGREGPIAQIGGAIGSAVGQFMHLSGERMKVLVACGAGAGIATTFNAPIGGLMFAQEIVLLGETELANLTLLVISTTTGVVTSRALMGNAAVFHVQPFIFRSYVELLTYALMGVLLGVLSAIYIRMFHAIAGFFRRWQLSRQWKLMLGLLAVAAIAIPLPQNLSDGYPVIDQAFLGRLAGPRMATLAAAKMLASSISLGCGAPGGVFGPIFFIGSMAGGAFRSASALILPGLTGPRGSYALVALGAFLAATTHAPLTSIFLLFEMTQDYQIAMPAMIATITALVVARAIEPESIDTFALAREGKTLQIGKDRLLLAQITVGSVMSRDIRMIAESASLQDVLHAAGETAQNTLPVVDAEGELRGVIVMHDLLGLLASRGELGSLVNAFDICRRNPPVVTPDSSLDVAGQLMEHEGIDELAVVEHAGGGRLLGLVARNSIALAFNRAKISIATLSAPSGGIFWSTGYRVARINVPLSAAGRTLRALDPRGRFGVSVLAVQDCSDPEAGFVPTDADRTLKSGDVIIAAGRSASIRQFQRQLDSAKE